MPDWMIIGIFVLIICGIILITELIEAWWTGRK